MQKVNNLIFHQLKMTIMKTAAKILIMTLLFGSMTAMFSCSDDPEDPEPVLSTETDILTFTINNFQTGAADIDATSHTVAVEVANGTNLGGLLAEFTISAGATSDPATGTIKDYTNPVTITVTAEDGTTTQAWTITVTEAPPGLSAATDILAFSIPEQTSIEGDANTHTIDVVVAIGTNLGALTPVFTLSAGATSSPVTGTEGNYTSPVTITVTAEDNTTTQDWTVTVTEGTAELSTETDILTFTIPGQTEAAVIHATSGTIDVLLANGAVLTALTPTFALSEGASSVPATGTEGNYSSAVIITVTAEDGNTTRDWTVNVTETPVGGSTSTDILSWGFDGIDWNSPADINDVDHTVTAEVANGTNLTALTAIFVLSGGETTGATSSPGSNTVQDYSTPLIITVTAEDGITIQDWTVTVTEAAEVGETVVIFGDGETKATAITDLVVDGIAYNVEFIFDEPVVIYSAYPGIYSFTTKEDALTALDAVNVALNDAGATSVGGLGGAFNYNKARVAYEAVSGAQQVKFMFNAHNTAWENRQFGETAPYEEPFLFASFTKK
jgi:hypothetical protein